MPRRFATAIPLAALAIAPGGLFAAPGAPSVYPAPHEMKVTGGMLALDAGSTVRGSDLADPEAVKLLLAQLSCVPAGRSAYDAGTISEIIVGECGDPAVMGCDSGIPDVSGAYRISATPGRLVIVGRDGRGTFYAMQTLRQLLDADADPSDLPAVEINDAPDIAFRGVVEGFYGKPWTQRDRLELFAFCGRHKMDSYIYAPNDDSLRRAPNWRKAYPEKDAERIRELVTVARANKVDFVWSLHPGKEIGWTAADCEALKAKFESMYALGVRSFAVFLDNMRGDGANPAKQAEALNRLNREFVDKMPGVTPLVIMPGEYNKSWSNPKKGGYLDTLGDRLDPSVRILWTGDRIVADLDAGSMEYVNALVRRKACVWWNFPVSDYVRNRLLMGPAGGNTAAAARLMAGFVSNPMERAEASKVALYGVAGYAWNASAYDPDSAACDAMREILPGAPEAFRTFCSHNSDTGPNGHGYRRAESVAVAAVAKTFLDSFRAGKTDTEALATLRAEFSRIAAAPAAIRAGGNPRLIEEIGPWLDAFRELGVAGEAAMDLAAAGDSRTGWAAYARASAAMAAMAEISRTNNRNGSRPGVKTGTLVLEPLVSRVLKASGAKILSALSGRPVAAVFPVTNFTDTEGVEKMADADAGSFYYAQQIQKSGDWFGLDLGVETPVSKVTLLMGRHRGDHDIVHKGQLEATRDGGATWEPLGPPTTGERVSWAGVPVPATRVRYRVLTAGKLDGTKDNVWTAIRSFRVNDELTAKAFTSVEGLARVPTHVDGETVSLTPQAGVFRFSPGRHVGIELPEVVGLAKLEIDLSLADPATWTKVEVSPDGRKWGVVAATATAAGTALTFDFSNRQTGFVRAKFVRVRNSGKVSRDAKLAAFKLTLAPGAGPVVTPFSDGDLSTSGPLGMRQAVEIPGEAPGVALLFASGDGRGVKVGVATARDAEPEPLGAAPGDFAEYALPPGRKWLVITPGSPDAKLHEIVWRVK